MNINKQVRRTVTATIFVIAVIPVAASASQNYSVLNNNAQLGMLMSQTASAGVIAPTTEATASSLVGVVATPSENDFSRQPGQVSVASDGTTNALVSTVNGSVGVGDRIGASSLVGVGAKSTKSGWIVGIAQGSLDAKTAGASPVTVTDSKGVKHQVVVASIPVVIKPTYYNLPAAAVTPAKKTAVPETVQNAADALAGKHVSPLALILSFVLFIIGSTWSGFILNAAIRGGFLGIARQPLAQRAIARGVLQAFLFAFAILSVVSVTAFLMLRIL